MVTKINNPISVRLTIKPNIIFETIAVYTILAHHNL